MKASKYRLQAELEGGHKWDLTILARDITWVTMWLNKDKPFIAVTITLIEKNCTNVHDSFGARTIED